MKYNVECRCKKLSGTSEPRVCSDLRIEMVWNVTGDFYIPSSVGIPYCVNCKNYVKLSQINNQEEGN